MTPSPPPRALSPETYESLIGKVFPPPAQPNGNAPQRAAEIGVATIASAVGATAGREPLLTRGALRRLVGQGCAAGWAITVWNPPGNNTMLRFALEACRPGDFIVVVTPVDGAAQWGELAHEWARARQAAGVLVDGSVRDIAAITRVGLSLWGRSVDPRQAEKRALGYVNGPVEIGGTCIRPGDLVVADDDAVMVLAPDQVDEALESARHRADYESTVLRGTRQGKPWPSRQTEPVYAGLDYMAQPWSP